MTKLAREAKGERFSKQKEQHVQGQTLVEKESILGGGPQEVPGGYNVLWRGWEL